MIEDGRTLVVVADGRRARLFEESRRGGPLHEHQDWLADLPDYRPGLAGAHGQVHDRFGHGSHAVTHETPANKGEQRFLVELVNLVEIVVRDRKFDHLVLIAAPRALGILRKALPDSLSRKLAESEPHDRLDATVDVIHEALRALRLASA